jgi:gamma-glutamyltranspeptidase/glutathione hydrolase
VAAYRFRSRRSEVSGTGGVVATSQPLAAQAGLQMLQAGGTAADAAVAAAAALNVVEPMSTGLGGDAFALIYWAADRRVYALNASGRAPAAATLERFLSLGHARVPREGILPVTVPGSAAGWADLLARFGRFGLDRALQPAIRYATEGYPVTEVIAGQWHDAVPLLEQDQEARRVFLPGGRAPRAGQRFACPELAASLRRMAEEGPAAMYRGALARAIVATSQELGGLLSEEDLATHTSTWVEPIHSDYRGYRVYECPPNGQGITALEALNILSGDDLTALGYESSAAFHLKMEAIKLAMTDAARYVADPARAAVPVDGLLAPEYAARRRALISAGRAIRAPQPGAPQFPGDTVYLCAADAQGNAVSFINSLSSNFGSGVVARGTGILLQNRGAGFSLDPQHPNCLAPGKRSFHTIIPCLVTREGSLAICYGVMGGMNQAQGHVQVLTNIVDHGMGPQEALDAPRFRYDAGNSFGIERGLGPGLYEALRGLGHDLTFGQPGRFGGGQVILVDGESGAYRAGSDPRKDGQAVAF